MKRCVLLIFVLPILGCATVELSSITKQDLIGDYYPGNGFYSLSLFEDGAYETKWLGCGFSESYASGKWQYISGNVVLEQLNYEGIIEPEFNVLNVILYKRKLSLLPENNKKDHNELMKKYGKSFYVFTKESP